MTYPEQDVINRRQDHVHLEDRTSLSILRWTGHPGGDSVHGAEGHRCTRGDALAHPLLLGERDS